MALLCFLKSLVIQGRFDGPSCISLSAVKHLGMDNNSQFYDAVNRVGKKRGFLSASLILQISLTEESSLHRTTRGIILLLKSLKSTNMQFEQMESGCFDIYRLKS